MPPTSCAGVDGVLRGSVSIGSGGDDPSVLEGIRRVEGSVVVEGTDLSDLDFMSCVEEIGGDLRLVDNDSLVSVAGLWSVSSLEGAFVLSGNDALEIFDGLPNLKAVGGVGQGDLILEDNTALVEITGFLSLVGVNRDFIIRRNPVLTHIAGLEGVRVIGAHLEILDNPSLCRCSILCMANGIVMPAVPPDDWVLEGNDESC